MKILNNDEISFFTKSSTLNFENLTKLRLKSIVINLITKSQNAKTSTNNKIENFSIEKNKPNSFNSDNDEILTSIKIDSLKFFFAFIVNAIVSKKMFFND